MKKKLKIQCVDWFKKLTKELEYLLNDKYELEFCDQPDFLFYSVYGTGIEHYQYKNCVKIFWSAEGVLPDFNECDYALGFYPMDVGERYCQIPYLAFDSKIQDREQFRNSDISRKKFCNFIYSNFNNGKGAILRQEFCKKLMEYKMVDCPGKVLNNMKDAIEARNANWAEGKKRFLRDYKFTIAFENVSMPGMITEKLYHSYLTGSIPIYWGAPDVGEIFNSASMVNCMQYDSWEAVIERIIEIDKDDDEFRRIVQEKPFLNDSDTKGEQRKKEFLYKIIEKGNYAFEKDPLGWDSGIKAAIEKIELQNSIIYKGYEQKKRIKNFLEKIRRKVEK
ncbi:MAG: glycosyltransferase family 10 [Lachnospiraceae bacterium]|nr:glycosyltransferase family 10 [Lachnospiraceae bacterium]